MISLAGSSLWYCKSILEVKSLILDSFLVDKCPIKVEPLGCYHDKYHDRAMTNEVSTMSDLRRIAMPTL